MKSRKLMPLIGLVFCGFCACKKESESNTTTNTNPTTSLELFKKIYGATSVTQDGNFAVIQAISLPDHKSPYYQGTQWESSKYEAYNGSNTKFELNPNRIVQQNLTFRIPMTPKEATTKTATPLGSIGIALNGVILFNQYAAMSAPLTSEINSFDQHGGHPQQQGQYHYHIEPTYLTATKGKSVLLGWLLDGFPVYGPVENAKTLISNDLDAYHGHTHATAEYPNGIYHYHFTADAPYLNGNGFFGVAGTVSR